jgi:Uma2 family endonuclease
MHAYVPLPAGDDDIVKISQRNPGWRVERTPSGEIVMTPPTGGASSRRNALLIHLVWEWCERNRYIAFDSNGGFRLPDSSVVAPDAAIVPVAQWETLTKKQREKFLPMVPAAAIELVSGTDNPSELREKLQTLQSFGTPYVVLLDPYRNEIWTGGEPPAGFDIDFRRVVDLD